MAATRTRVGNAAMRGGQLVGDERRQLGDQGSSPSAPDERRRRPRGSGPGRSPTTYTGSSSVPTASRNQMASSPTCGGRGAVDDDRRAVLEPALLLDHAAAPRVAASPASTSATRRVTRRDSTAPAPGSPNSRPRSVAGRPRRARRRRRTPTSSASVRDAWGVRRHRDRLRLGGRGGGRRSARSSSRVSTSGADHREDDRERGSDDPRRPQESPSLSLKLIVMPSSLATSVDSSTLRAMTACLRGGDGVGVVEGRGRPSRGARPSPRSRPRRPRRAARRCRRWWRRPAPAARPSSRIAATLS